MSTVGGGIAQNFSGKNIGRFILPNILVEKILINANSNPFF